MERRTLLKAKPDFKSMKFMLWFYFAIFAVLLMGILWFLQIFFLETYYESMKTREIVRASEEIADEYGELDLNKMSEYSYKNDMYIHIESEKGFVIYTADSANQRPSMLGIQREIASVRQLLAESPSGKVSFVMSGSSDGVKTLIYGRLIDDTPGSRIYLIIFSPLSPVESTVDILANQLILITVVSLLLAFLLSYFLSRRLSKPLVNITDAASALGRGEYGVPFEGGPYTEISRLADTLNYTSGELEKSRELQKDLIANVSHDLRTPLTMVKSYAEMVRDLSGEDPVKRNQHLQVIIDEADRLNRLVTDLLDLSKMQSGVSVLNVEEFSLTELIRDLLVGFELLKEKGYKIEFEEAGDVRVTGDPGRIRQVLSNLMDNAVFYGGERKEITIFLSETARGALCRVRDSGSGIPADELEHIFERYYRVSRNAARSSSGGAGLGLSIVKEILTLHGARYGVESQPGSGTTFWFEIPK